MNDTSNKTESKILIVDNESDIVSLLSNLLTQNGYSTNTAFTLCEAVEKLNTAKYDLIITEIQLNDGSGLDIIHKIKSDKLNTEAILLTDSESIDSAVGAMQTGVIDYITKPLINNEILVKVNKALKHKKMTDEIFQLRQHVAMTYGFDNIIGTSKAMLQIKETAQRVAATDISILITGAAGTGKELLAKALHHHSKRRNNRFVIIDCGAIPEKLMESELFGIDEKSSLTTERTKIGLLEEAEGGTVFLDEINNLPQAIQIKMLRFLQNSEIQPVGATEPKKVNVRVITATNVNLIEMVKNGSFREDLYYRLSVIPINIPPLKNRLEDLSMLTDYFIRKICANLNRPHVTIDRNATEKLLQHNWPGNIRELENTLKRSIALCKSDHLEADDIIFIYSNQSEQTIETDVQKRTLTFKGKLLDSSQKSLIIKALNDNNWNYTKTAEELGIGRTTLWRKIKKYDLKQETEKV